MSQFEDWKARCIVERYSDFAGVPDARPFGNIGIILYKNSFFDNRIKWKESGVVVESSS